MAEASLQLKDLQESIEALRSELSVMSSVIRREVHQEMDEFITTFQGHLLSPVFLKECAGAISREAAANPDSGVTSYLWPYLGTVASVGGTVASMGGSLLTLGMSADDDAPGIGNPGSNRSINSKLRTASFNQEAAERVEYSELEQPLLASPSSPSSLSNQQTRDLEDGSSPISGTHSEDFRSSVRRRYGRLKAGQEAQTEQSFVVESLYNDTGFAQRWARTDSWFHSLTLFVIVMNVFWIGVDTDLNRADVLSDAPVLSQVVNNIFCVYFVVEIAVRFLAFKNKRNCCKDSWFVFDFILVLFMVWESWIEVAIYAFMDKPPDKGLNVGSVVRSYRLLRLTRLARVARISNMFPELMILIKGMVAAMRSVAAILCLLFLFIFLFGIMFRQLLSDIVDNNKFLGGKFGSVPESMNTLLVQVIAGVDSDLMAELKTQSWFYYLVFLIFIFLGTLTLMNMLIGVLCEVMSRVSSEESENTSLKELEHEIGVIIDQIDEDQSGTISQDEFEELMHSDAGLESLDRLGVDIPAFSEFCSYIFKRCDELSLSEFCNLVVQFRGSKTATVKDIVDMRKYISMTIDLHLRKLLTKLMSLHT